MCVCLRVFVCVCVWGQWVGRGREGGGVGGHSPCHLQCPHGWRGEGGRSSFCGDESEVSLSRGGEESTPPLLSSRSVPPPVSHCWAF